MHIRSLIKQSKRPINLLPLVIVLLLAGTELCNAQSQRNLVIQQNHEGGIFKIAAHPSKEIVATAEEHVVKLWDSRSWKLLHTISIEKAMDHDWAAIGLDFGASHLIVTLVELQTDAYLDNYFGNKLLGTRTSLAVHIAGGQITLDDGANFILAPKEGALIPIYQQDAQLIFGSGPGQAVTALPQGNFKAVDNTNRSWFLQPDIADDSLFITFARYSPEEELLVCGYSEGTIELRNPFTFAPLHTIRTNLQQITDVHFAADSLIVVEGSNQDSQVLVLDLKQKNIRRAITLNCETINLAGFEHQFFSFAPLIFDEVCNFGTAFQAKTGWLALATQFNRIRLINLYTREERYADSPFSGGIYDIASLHDGEHFLLTGDYGSQPRFAQSPMLNFNPATGAFTEIPHITFDYTEAIGFTEAGDAIYSLNRSSFTKWSLDNMERIQANVVDKRGGNYTNFLEASRQSFMEVPPAFEDPLLVHSLNQQDTGFVDLSFLIPKQEEEWVVGLVPGRFVITSGSEEGGVVYALGPGSKMYSFQVDSEEDFMLSEDGNWLAYLEREASRLNVANTNDWKIAFQTTLDREASEYFSLKKQFAFSRDIRQFAFFQSRLTPPEEGEAADSTLHHIQVCTLLEKKNKWQTSTVFPYDKPINVLSFGYEGKTVLAATGEAPFVIQRWDIQSGRLMQELQGHTQSIESIADHEKLLFSHAEDNTYRLWDKPTSRELLRIMNNFDGIRISEVILNKDNYYMAKGQGLDMVGYQVGERGYPFEQLDLKHNRPDKVIAALPGAAPALVQAYEKAYHKRLEKMGFTPDMLSDDYQVPEITVRRPSQEINTDSSTISFMVYAKSNSGYLDRINVWVNDVPVYGMKGIGLRPNRSATEQRQLTLELSPGPNKIQVSALNQSGAESLKETFRITYHAPNRKPALHLITIGVGQFRDTAMNLAYVEKDLRDVAALFREQQNLYDTVIVHELINEQVSVDNLRQAKRELQKTKVDGHVIVFIAGHGLLDAQLNYFLAAYDADFLNPSMGGIPYEELEQLLDGIPARQKLLLMDACHSGEIDEENIQLLKEQRQESGPVTFRAFPGRRPSYKKMGLNNSFELMKELFVDLRRGTGATVISSASGVEFALEGRKWQNGVFTYALLRGLRERKADIDQDGQVMVSELQSYLAKKVPELTNQQQRPAMRVENISNDWRVW